MLTFYTIYLYVYSIEDDDTDLKLCVKDITIKIKIWDSVVGNKEVMRCKYISSILHTVVSFVYYLIILP